MHATLPAGMCLSQFAVVEKRMKMQWNWRFAILLLWKKKMLDCYFRQLYDVYSTTQIVLQMCVCRITWWWLAKGCGSAGLLLSFRLFWYFICIPAHILIHIANFVIYKLVTLIKNSFWKTNDEQMKIKPQKVTATTAASHNDTPLTGDRSTLATGGYHGSKFTK